MSTAPPAVQAASPAAARSVASLRPSFSGIVRGEALKLSRQLSLWLTLGGSILLLAVIVLAVSGAQNLKPMLLADPTAWAYDKLETFGTLFQIGSGIFLLIFGSRLMGMEYSSGTIRILYARGTGRLQLLLAKMFTLAVVGVALLAGYLLLVGAILALMIVALSGSLDSAHHISNAFWSDLGRWALVQGISMGMAILIASAAVGVGRSLAFGIAAALAYYPVDNFLNILEILGIRATGHDQPWTAISQYMLSPNLNVLLTLMEPSHRARPAFASPLAPVDLTHALVVVGLFGLAFAIIALVRTLRPDVLE
ncbi:MAG TPA: ABC transporter permease [Candidatus Limnocylindrales bacterium]|nr:ABC transporter permease [Candidatus Limnocylindrales bacterium]